MILGILFLTIHIVLLVILQEHPKFHARDFLQLAVSRCCPKFQAVANAVQKEGENTNITVGLQGFYTDNGTHCYQRSDFHLDKIPVTAAQFIASELFKLDTTKIMEIGVIMAICAIALSIGMLLSPPSSFWTRAAAAFYFLLLMSPYAALLYIFLSMKSVLSKSQMVRSFELGAIIGLLGIASAVLGGGLMVAVAICP